MGIALPDGQIPVYDHDETFHEKPENQWLEMWRSLRANRAALVSLVFVLALVVIAVIGPYITPYNPIETEMSNALKPPSAEHWFGTDQLGMDIFSRVIAGTRVSLTVGLLAVSIALTTGIVLGAIAGYAGGWVDTVIMRVMDMMLAIPSILLAITLMAALGKGIDKAVIAIGLVSIPEYARIVRGNILSIKENDYIAAAHVVGLSDARIIFRHVLPNALSVIIVRATLGISSAILDTAALGFLGLGVQPPQPE
ncbi:MAG: ABC transporter permease, partial [Actinomycetota bacterium]